MENRQTCDDGFSTRLFVTSCSRLKLTGQTTYKQTHKLKLIKMCVCVSMLVFMFVCVSC